MLSDEEWSQKLNDWKFTEQVDLKNMEVVFKKALSEVLSEMLGNK